MVDYIQQLCAEIASRKDEKNVTVDDINAYLSTNHNKYVAEFIECGEIRELDDGTIYVSGLLVIGTVLHCGMAIYNASMSLREGVNGATIENINVYNRVE